MAKGTDFGGVHSNRDLHLIQQSADVQPAQPKLNLIDIPGADGSKDLSDQPAGRVAFKNREIAWTFALYPGDDWHARHSQVADALNGRQCRITLDDDPRHYYLGRLSVTKYKKDSLLRQITVKATCSPYKYEQAETVINHTVMTTETSVNIMGSRMPVVPAITVSKETVITVDGASFTLAAGGPHKILELQLREGLNTFKTRTTGSTTGTIQIVYQKGAL